MKKEVRKKKGTERKVLKAIAFSEMFVMILASFAFAFIFSAGMIGAATTNPDTEWNNYLNSISYDRDTQILSEFLKEQSKTTQLRIASKFGEIYGNSKTNTVTAQTALNAFSNSDIISYEQYRDYGGVGGGITNSAGTSAQQTTTGTTGTNTGTTGGSGASQITQGAQAVTAGAGAINTLAGSESSSPSTGAVIRDFIKNIYGGE
jgi:hypothetical protein